MLLHKQSLHGGTTSRHPRVRSAATFVAEALERRVVLATTSPVGPVLFYDGFESDGFAGWTTDVMGSGTTQVVEKADAPVRAGFDSAKFTLPAGSRRSELYVYPPDPKGAERWYSTSVFVPQDYKADPLRDIVAQWHEEPDWHLGETWRVPPLSLALMNSQWQIASRWDSRPVNDNSWDPPAPYGGRKEYYSPLERGVWTDWVFHLKWSYQSGGLLEAWKNGVKIVNPSGPNTYNDQSGNYFKVGLYHPDVALDTNPVTPLKVLFQDEVKIGDHSATYAQMAPAAAPVTTVTVRAPADGYVRDGTYAAQNFAQAAVLEVKKVSAPGYSRESFLRFDLSQFGTASDIASAKVRLFGKLLSNAASSMTAGLYPVASATWSESGLTWNNRPAAGTAAVGTATVTGTTGRWYEFDLTSYLKQQKTAGAAAVAFALKGTALGQGWAGFNSDEAAASQPQLVVTQQQTPTVGTVTGLTLIDAAKDTAIGPFTSGAKLDLGGGKQYNVRAETSGTIGSIVFALDGALAKAESFPPYTVGGDAGTDYFPWNVSPGSHTLVATPYSGADGTGTAGKPVTVIFTVTDSGTTVPVVLRPPADGYVRDGTYAAQNFGQAAVLEVKKVSAPGYSRESYVRFDLSGVGAAADITSAKVRLFGRMLNTASPSMAVGLYPVASASWGEAALTWNTRPAAGATPAATVTVSGTAGKWYEFDVTSYLKQQKAAGAASVAFALKGPVVVDAWAGFSSDEAAANPPQLVVTQREAQTPQGIIVSTGSLSVPEGSSASFTVKLAAAPTVDVVVNVTKQLQGDLDLNASVEKLTFTPANWNTPQTVTVTANQDADTDNGFALFDLSSEGVEFKSVDATEQDDDVAAPVTVTLRDPADAYVRDGTYAGQTFWTVPDLQVKKVAAPGYSRESYVRFDLEGTAPAGNIQSAKLRVFGRMLSTAAPSMVVGLHPVAGTAWTEPELTWNNRPATGTLASSVTVSGTAGKWYEFDVTGYLKQQKSAWATRVAFALKGVADGEGWAGFSSDEAAANPPEMVIVQTPAPGPSLDARVEHAAAFADDQLRRTLTELNDATTAWPHTTDDDGTWRTEARDEWSSGFFPGALWQMYDLTGDAFWKEKATNSALPLKDNQTLTEDNQFRTFVPFHPLLRATGDPQYRDILLASAASKSTQYDGDVGAFRASWRKSASGDPRANFGVLMDHMMDLELMFWAAKQPGGQQKYYDQAVSNARTVAAHMVRPDGGSYHWGYFDGVTGQFISGETAQGYANNSTWARGQAWGIYAFTVVYRETGDLQFLTTARKMADFFLRNLPPDKVPSWDFNDPSVPDTFKDSSTAAIAASALFELGRLDSGDGEKYTRAGEEILGSLATKPYLAEDTDSRAILNRGAWYVPPPESSGESSTIWGDYYFLEAIKRYRGG
jgi:rhamnogalacturonyl hydrolase YesR